MSHWDIPIHNIILCACIWNLDVLWLTPLCDVHASLQIFGWMQVALTCWQTSRQSVQCLQVYKPPLPEQFPSWNCHNFKTLFVASYLPIGIDPFPICPTPTKSKTSFQDRKILPLRRDDLSTTSCQYWVANPMRAQQEEKSATHLHQINIIVKYQACRSRTCSLQEVKERVK